MPVELEKIKSALQQQAVQFQPSADLRERILSIPQGQKQNAPTRASMTHMRVAASLLLLIAAGLFSFNQNDSTEVFVEYIINPAGAVVIAMDNF